MKDLQTKIKSSPLHPVQQTALHQWLRLSTIVDMARTMTNVTGAATAAVITAATEGLVDEEIYNSDKSKHVAVNN